jgi:hypothetical protein
MYRFRRFVFALCVAVCVPPLAYAQAPAPAPAPTTPMTPSEPHEKLSFFIGSWTTVEAPADQRFRETCGWLNAGRRHVVCHSRWETATGPREGLSIFSYRAADSTYVYQGFRAGGATETLLGRPSPDGQGWEFGGETGTGATRQRTRVVITSVGDGAFRFAQQTATGDGEWSKEEVVNYRAVR